MVRSKENLIGAYAFLIGVVLAVLLGSFNELLRPAGSFFYTTLVIIGLIVGFMNVGDKNSVAFLFASLSLVIMGALGTNPLIYLPGNIYIINVLRNVLVSLMVLFIPATIIVALKTVFAMAKV